MRIGNINIPTFDTRESIQRLINDVGRPTDTEGMPPPPDRPVYIDTTPEPEPPVGGVIPTFDTQEDIDALIAEILAQQEEEQEQHERQGQLEQQEQQEQQEQREQQEQQELQEQQEQ